MELVERIGRQQRGVTAASADMVRRRSRGRGPPAPSLHTGTMCEPRLNFV
jgi:hypothetical protein